MSLLALSRVPPESTSATIVTPGTKLRERLFEAFDAILDARDFGFVDDRDAAALTDGLANQLSGLKAALHVIAGDMRDDVALATRARDVGGEDREYRRCSPRRSRCRSLANRMALARSRRRASK